MTPEDFKSEIINMIQSRDIKSELLLKMLKELPKDKLALLENYRTNVILEPISDNEYKWEREGETYFLTQLHVAEENFCLKRLEHLIEVKSHLTEHGIAGFSRSVSCSAGNHEKIESTKEKRMDTDFSSVDWNGFTPSPSLKNSVHDGDITKIRVALFLQMNNESLSTVVIRQALAWTLSRHPNLFVTYEENGYAQAMVHDKTKWDSHYYGMQEVYASSNFSSERISHMIQVREHVFTIAQDGARPATFQNTQLIHAPKQSTPHREQSSTGSIYRPDSKPENNTLKSMLLIGGVVAAIALVILAVIV
ncbi:hypothetical protein HJ127_04915 [Vibrio parahaemolyticus]|nr:hypothetical protein [Vibrio parahaemolyticus]